jgi:hypothetical protein
VSTNREVRYLGSLSRLVWQWVRQEISAAVLAAGYDDLNPAHVAVFRNPTIDGRRPSELAEEMQITRQSVNELLGHLERRPPCPAHRPGPSTGGPHLQGC